LWRLIADGSTHPWLAPVLSDFNPGHSIREEFTVVGQELPLQFTVVVLAVLVTAATDVWKFKVHNILTLPLLAGGLIYHAIAAGPAGLAGSFLGALCGFGLLISLYLKGGMGAGDVKLMTGVGAWLGLPMIFYVFIASSLAAGIYALFVIVLYGRTGETWTNLKIIWFRISAAGRHLGAEDRVETAVEQQDRRGRIIPFAAMIALGVLAVLAWSKYVEAH
jgi:prepilin peptidase CpaA